MTQELAVEVSDSIEGLKLLDERPEIMVTYTHLEETDALCALRDQIVVNNLTARFKFSARPEEFERFQIDCELAGIDLNALPVQFETYSHVPTQPRFMKPAPGLMLQKRGCLGSNFQFATHDKDLWVEGFWLQSNGNQVVDPVAHLDRHNLFTANWYLSGHGVGYKLNGGLIKPPKGTTPILTMHRGTGHKFPAALHRGYAHGKDETRANMFATLSPSSRVMHEFSVRPPG